MNIDEIIRKCVEVPGISIERGEYSAGLFLNGKDGKGSVTFFPLFPGLTLAYISVNARSGQHRICAERAPRKKGPLLLNYCVTGRCEIILNNGNFVYVTDGDLSLTEHFAQRQYVYPRRIYEGLEFFIELDTLAAQSAWLLEEFGLDFHCVVERYCRNGSTYISKAVPDAEELLKKLWSLYHEPMPFAVMQMKIYSLALFSLLMAQKETSVPSLRLFYRNAGEHCKTGGTDHHSRPAAASSGLGTGCEVFYQRNQYEELFSRRLRAKHIGVSSGGQNEKSRGTVSGRPAFSI